jgi:hypothetical protein
VPICLSTAYEGAQVLSVFQYGCGKQLVVVCSLNNVIMPHFIVAMLTQITNIWANFARCNSVRVHPYAYPQHIGGLAPLQTGFSFFFLTIFLAKNKCLQKMEKTI